MSDGIYINQRITIPESEISFRFAHSSGPGGQHANKTASKAVLLFDAAASETLRSALTEAERARLLGRLRPRLDSEGVLQVAAQDTRSQHQNRELAIARFQTILGEALKQPKARKKTRPSRAANERRLQKKRQQSQRKQERSGDWGA